ncbi:unnamed protein product [Camellia sinensis]
MATWFMGGSGNRRGGRNLQRGDSSRRGGGRGSGNAEDETPFTLLDASCAYHDRFGKRHFVMPKYYRDPCGLVEDPSDNQTGYGLANARLLKWPAIFIERVQMERLCRENRLKVPKARSVEILKKDLVNVDRLCERLQRKWVWDSVTNSNSQGDIGQWQKWRMTVPFFVSCNASLAKDGLAALNSSMIPNMPCAFALRKSGCRHIYSMMSMHEEVVALALQVDPELAKVEADKVEDDEDLRKKLWLMVAKHVVEQEKGTKRENIRKAIAFLKEIDGLLKIEDILPFFLDFALIDDFKEAICSSLEDYNKQIEQLKQEMDDATHDADNIRNDISARYAVIDCDEDYGVCQRKILNAGWDHRMARGYTSIGAMAPFYVFPCGHAFHAQCLIAYVTRAEYILDLQKQLTLLGGESKKESNGTLTEEESTIIRSQLDDAIDCECPFCGDLMIREISLPSILPGEAYEAASWEIRPYNIGAQKSLSLVV